MRNSRWIALLLAFIILINLTFSVAATTSEEIQEEIDRLEEEAEAIAEQQAALEEEKAQISSEALTYAEQKRQIDLEIQYVRESVDNINEQIHQYNMLIAERQVELDALQQEHTDLLNRYSLRMRAMQERGEVSIWSVIFSSKSFADLLNSRAMIEEIARADHNMLNSLQASAQEILIAKDLLAEQKVALELKRLELAEQEAQLAELRAQSDAMIAALNADRARLEEEILKAEALEAELVAQIAQKEEEYNEKLKEENGGFIPDPNEHGFIFPVDPSGFVYLSSPYGMRYHPISGNYTMHNGVDFAAYLGTPTYAAKSGVVTTARYGAGWGNYVVINHGDGFSTLYAHFDTIKVSEGDIVSQGQIIGTVGSTGNSTGPHLHFTMYYNGDTVNPMIYVSLP